MVLRYPYDEDTYKCTAIPALPGFAPRSPDVGATVPMAVGRKVLDDLPLWFCCHCMGIPLVCRCPQSIPAGEKEADLNRKRSWANLEISANLISTCSTDVDAAKLGGKARISILSFLLKLHSEAEKVLGFSFFVLTKYPDASLSRMALRTDLCGAVTAAGIPEM
ncbi:hypothetical protein AK812_SmicGene21179 [Symbiodinium microadriaticum]|uniref:Uncharacterized protein n=1 Tax=Symbiodinium microadriaticum TaxID=2951 RepID=A0A1Q9DN05_SYMMI|nr:hypothetical protein AK812_SmicGene21179 [Symbiodinium microadriaticum]